MAAAFGREKVAVPVGGVNSRVPAHLIRIFQLLRRGRFSDLWGRCGTSTNTASLTRRVPKVVLHTNDAVQLVCERSSLAALFSCIAAICAVLMECTLQGPGSPA